MSYEDTRDWATFRGSSDFVEAMRRLAGGAKITQTAEWIQERGWCAGIQLQSVVRNLQRARDEVAIIPENSALRLDDASKTIASSLDAVGELEKVLALQIARVNKGTKLEIDLGVILPAVGKEVTALTTMLVEYVKLLQTLGYAPKVPERMLVGMVQMGSQAMQQGATGQALKLLPEAERMALLQAVLDVEQKMHEQPQEGQGAFRGVETQV